MSEASQTSSLENWLDMPSVTSSPESADGVTHSDSPGGPMIGPYGPDPALASLSAKQVEGLELRTSGISGLYGAISLRSVALQQSLVSKLRARLQLLGSPLFKMTWKVSITPSRRLIYRLRAQGHRTSDSAFTSWPTTTAVDGKRGDKEARPWDTGKPLPQIAALASWPTPMTGTPAQKGNNEAGNTDSSRKTVALCSWATPTTRDHKDGASDGTAPVNALLGRQAWLASGAMPNGFRVETASGGQLSPAHSRWLMGFPVVWDSCGVTAMQSLPRSRRSSSPHTAR